ncbi:unnamed protein product [Polarella glacialis]|uniref:Uncharacterized protein n=1 Tax=Polarella glacialis TaxID=89957 RepID=A0A813GGT6_POLGL|nr:unnamed protein product [Polarella glacialis]
MQLKAASGRGGGAASSRSPSVSLPARVLLSCTRDPITLTEMSQRMSDMKGAGRFQARVDALRELETLGLGAVRETRRRTEQAPNGFNVQFRRALLNAEVVSRLQELGVPEQLFRPSISAVEVSSLPMEGAGANFFCVQAERGERPVRRFESNSDLDSKLVRLRDLASIFPPPGSVAEKSDSRPVGSFRASTPTSLAGHHGNQMPASDVLRMLGGGIRKSQKSSAEKTKSCHRSADDADLTRVQTRPSKQTRKTPSDTPVLDSSSQFKSMKAPARQHLADIEKDLWKCGWQEQEIHKQLRSEAKAYSSGSRSQQSELVIIDEIHRCGEAGPQAPKGMKRAASKICNSDVILKRPAASLQRPAAASERSAPAGMVARKISPVAKDLQAIDITFVPVPGFQVKEQLERVLLTYKLACTRDTTDINIKFLSTWAATLKAHDAPWAAMAYYIRTKKNGDELYTVHCRSCSPPCSFRPTAIRSTSLQAWALWGTVSNERTSLKKAEETRGRPPQKDQVFPVVFEKQTDKVLCNRKQLESFVKETFSKDKYIKVTAFCVYGFLAAHVSKTTGPHADGMTEYNMNVQEKWLLSERRLQLLMERRRDILQELSQPLNPASKQWRDVDFEFLVASANPCSAAGMTAGDERLRAVAARVDGPRTQIPLLCSAQLAETIQKLSHPDYVILCLDGKFRMTFGDYVVVFEAAAAMNLNFGPSQVKQWHSDMRLGIAKARSQIVSHAVPVSDWAHVTGVTTEGRSGIFNVLAKRLSPHVLDSSLKEYTFIAKWVCFTRAICNVYIFNILWLHLFKHLEESEGDRGAAAVKSLKRYHFSMVAIREEELWDANWRIGYDRVLVGAGAGSACQESWHSTVLANTIPQTYKSPGDLVRSLSGFAKSRLHQLRSERPSLPLWPAASYEADAPGKTKVDTFLVHGLSLRAEGRPTASELLQSGLCRNMAGQDSTDHAWYVVPRTLWRRVQVDTATMIKGKSMGVIVENMGAANVDWKLAENMFRNWCFVTTGPLVQEFWQQKLTKPAERTKHELALCTPCEEQAVQGPCEHAYAVLVCTGAISLQSCMDAKATPGRPPKNAGELQSLAGSRSTSTASVLQPGPRTIERQSAIASSSRPSSCASSSQTQTMSSQAQEMQRLLAKTGLCQPSVLDMVNAEEITVATLAVMDVVSTKQCFGITVGAAAGLRAAAIAQSFTAEDHDAAVMSQQSVRMTSRPSTSNKVNEVTELTESRSGEVDHQAQVRGPTLRKTNFDLVTEVLGCHKMPLGPGRLGSQRKEASVGDKYQVAMLPSVSMEVKDMIAAGFATGKKKSSAVYLMASRGLDLQAVFKELGSRGVLQLMVEGGAVLQGKLLKADLCQELRVYFGATLLGSSAQPWAQTGLTSTIGEAKFWQLRDLRRLGQALKELCSGALSPEARRQELGFGAILVATDSALCHFRSGSHQVWSTWTGQDSSAQHGLALKVICGRFLPDAHGGFWLAGKHRLNVAVNFFVVLSGFVTHWVCGCRIPRSGAELRSFYLNRLSRVVLCFWLSVVLSVLISWWERSFDLDGIWHVLRCMFFVSEHWVTHVFQQHNPGDQARTMISDQIQASHDEVPGDSFQSCPNAGTWTVESLVPCWLLYPVLSRLLVFVEASAEAWGLALLALGCWAVWTVPLLMAEMAPGGRMDGYQTFSYLWPGAWLPDFTVGLVAAALTRRQVAWDAADELSIGEFNCGSHQDEASSSSSEAAELGSAECIKLRRRNRGRLADSAAVLLASFVIFTPSSVGLVPSTAPWLDQKEGGREALFSHCFSPLIAAFLVGSSSNSDGAGGLVSRLLGKKSLAGLGAYSLEAYLFQEPLFRCILHFVPNLSDSAEGFVFFFLLLWLLAGLFAEYVEAPALQMLGTKQTVEDSDDEC